MAIALAMTLALSWFGPALDDHSAERDQAADLEAAQHQARALQRYEAVVQRMCGDNAAWMRLEDGAIQCYTKRGHKTSTVQTAEVTP